MILGTKETTRKKYIGISNSTIAEPIYTKKNGQSSVSRKTTKNELKQ